MTTGSGLATAGFSPFGLGTPTTNTRLVSPGYEQSAGGCVSSVKIAWGTKDYEYDDYGNEKPMSDTAQRVYMLCATTVGSRANWQTFGLQTPTHITSRTPREVENYVRAALRPVISDGSATLDSVEVTTENNMTLAVIRWTDNRQQEQRVTSVPLSQ
jgi:hypothetical protein